MVGSIKWCVRNYHHFSLLSKELFMATRMADRDELLSLKNEMLSVDVHSRPVNVTAPIPIIKEEKNQR